MLGYLLVLNLCLRSVFNGVRSGSPIVTRFMLSFAPVSANYFYLDVVTLTQITSLKLNLNYPLRA